jgi:hypothetical protein
MGQEREMSESKDLYWCKVQHILLSSDEYTNPICDILIPAEAVAHIEKRLRDDPETCFVRAGYFKSLKQRIAELEAKHAEMPAPFGQKNTGLGPNKIKAHPAEPKEYKDCPVCGGKMVFIRGRYPRSDKREVCPTCLQERMDNIKDISSHGYGVPCKEGDI